MGALTLLLSAWMAAVPASIDSGAGRAEDAARAMAEGYLSARMVEIPESPAQAGMPARPAETVARLDKGPLFLIDSVLVTGPAAFTAEKLGLIALSGQGASSARLASAARAVRAYLLDHGRPFAEVIFDFRVRPEEARVDLHVDILGGPGYKYGGTKQAGSRTRSETLERLMLLRFGEDYSESRLRLAALRLSRTGYFEAVAPGTLYRDSTRNLLYPSLLLTDLKGNRVGGIFGYDSEHKGWDGVNGYLDIHLINLRGTARDLDFSFESKTVAAGGEGAQEKAARFAFTEPWILGAPVGARVDLDIALQDSIYDEGNAGVTLFQDLGFRSRYSVSFADQFNRDYLAGTRSTAFKTGLGLLFDGRDRVPGTLRGVRLDSKANWLRRDLGDSSYYLVQSTHELGMWINRGRWVGHALAVAGGNWPLDGRANRGELFSLGGANTIRGFREKEFLTNLYAYTNLELQFLLAPGSRASLFVVPGLINRVGTGEDLWWRRVVGYGAGLEAGGREWTFGVSYALNPDRAPGDGFVHLRVTNNF